MSMTPLRDLTQGRYLPGASVVHRLDPRVKLGAACAAVIAAFVPGLPWGALWTWPLLAAGVGAARLPLGLYLRGFRPFAWLFVLTVLLHGVTTPGRVLLGLPWVGGGVTAEGLAQGAGVAAQLATAIGVSALLTLTTSPTDLVWGLERLGSPLARLGVPVGEFCTTLLLALQFFPLLRQEAEERLGVWKAGASDPGRTGRWARLRELPPLVAPFLRQVFQRAEAVAGELPSGGGTVVRTPGLGRPEAASLALAVLTLGAALWVRLGAAP